MAGSLSTDPSNRNNSDLIVTRLSAPETHGYIAPLDKVPHDCRYE